VWPWEIGLLTTAAGTRPMTLTERKNWESLFAWLAEDEPRWEWPDRPPGLPGRGFFAG
jgi:hypothetical protein